MLSDKYNAGIDTKCFYLIRALCWKPFLCAQLLCLYLVSGFEVLRARHVVSRWNCCRPFCASGNVCVLWSRYCTSTIIKITVPHVLLSRSFYAWAVKRLCWTDSLSCTCRTRNSFHACMGFSSAVFYAIYTTYKHVCKFVIAQQYWTTFTTRTKTKTMSYFSRVSIRMFDMPPEYFLAVFMFFSPGPRKFCKNSLVYVRPWNTPEPTLASLQQSETLFLHFSFFRPICLGTGTSAINKIYQIRLIFCCMLRLVFSDNAEN